MSKWIDFSIDERKAMIQRVVDSKHIDEAAAEKDWWVTAVLYALFQTKATDYLLFKGGTSLSKGWNIIDRFSEDIDLALGRDFFLNEKKLSCANCSSNTQLHNLREKGQDYIFGEFKEDLKEQLAALGLKVNVIAENEQLDENGEPLKVPHDKDPSVIFVQYTSLYSSEAAYAVPVVKIEINVLSMAEPYEMKRISSLVEQIYQDEDVDTDIVQTIKTVSPARTFLEKAFLLCEEYQKKEPKTYRMTRHFYDLEKLSHTHYADMALNDSTLYYDIVEHRKKFYHVGYVDYDKELPSTITIVPKAELISSYEKDYNDMRSSFIYGKSLEFNELLGFLETLQQRFRNVAPTGN
jgi:predicted nucleotidyltransferase component of viral defense system